MFKKRTLLALTLFWVVALLMGLKVFHVSHRDIDHYEKTLESLQPSSTKHQGVTQRNEVTKNLWLQNSEGYYQYRIKSEHSKLQLDQLTARETKIKEEMQEATCLLQQKIYYVDELGQEIKKEAPINKTMFPMQQICQLKVHQGSYDYITKHFVGDEVFIQIYEVSGHDLDAFLLLEDEKKVLEGVCDHIDFQFVEEAVRLQVTNLVAEIFSKDSLDQEITL